MSAKVSALGGSDSKAVWVSGGSFMERDNKLQDIKK